jgi:hypothetical protein
MMNDLRLLVQDQTASMPFPAKKGGQDPNAADLVDLILLGTVEFSREQIDRMPGRWAAEKREAYYSTLHTRRRKKKTDPFNGPP